MSNKRAYNLTAYSVIAGDESIPLDKSGLSEAQKVTPNQLKDYINPTDAQIVLTDGATTTWDYSAARLVEWTPGDNNTLDITNLVAPCTGLLKLIQNSTGVVVPVLPGNLPSGFVLSSNPGGFDLLTFFYDGTNIYWDVKNYGDTSSSLAHPILSGTVVSNTAINLVSTNVTNATGYKFERALDSAFTTGLTTLQNTSSRTLSDTTGLTPYTTYYYRVTAHASGYTDAVSSTLVMFTKLIEDIVWHELEHATTPGGGDLIATGTLDQGGTATKKLDKVNGNYIEQTVPNPFTDSNTAVIALCPTDDADYSWASGNSMFAGVYHYGGNSAVVVGDPSTNITLTPVSIGDKLRLEISGDDILVRQSSDGGLSFTTTHTVTGALTGVTDIFIKGIIAAAGTTGVRHAVGGGLI